MKLSRYITRVLLATAAVVLTASCQEDDLRGPDYTSVGEDVTVTLPVVLPEMDIQSRADLGEGQLNEVRSLWIRTYNAFSKESTSEWKKLTPGTSDREPVSHKIDIESKSGPSFIVAVANVENMGVSKDAPADIKPLSELLDAADTWDKFMAIAAVTPTEWNDVNIAPTPITMAGCYTTVDVGNTATHPALQDWGKTLNFEPVTIPAAGAGKTVSLDGGAIHLRRLVSHIKFNLKAGSAVNITPESYTIVNVPRSTWLYERDGDHKNFGDWSTSRENADEVYYSTPRQFTSQFFNRAADGTYTFDFWQGENKHDALEGSGCDTYYKRELEYKENGQNTGLYVSLTGDTWTPNNMASYVVLRCLVENKNQLSVDDDGNQTTGGTEVWRYGNAEFVIHLGYLNGIASDFSCYRNVDYTYNVTVNGVDEIRVEAFGTERYPGAEGVVSDIENEMISIDAHYAAFNIELTREELQNVNSDGIGFGYIITTWDDGVEYTFEENDEVTDDNLKYVDWVELRPTTAMNVLADYKPRSGDNNDGKTFTLRDAAGARNWTVTDPRFSSAGIYTVFVNEYTYETNANESNSGEGDPNWKRYVNQNARRFYIRVTRKVSDDGMSTYARSKYAVSQSSIVTYYSDRNFTSAEVENDMVVIPAGTAIGVERVNETEGLNLRSSLGNSTDIGTINGAATDPSNGRYNVWMWIQSKGYAWSNFVENRTITIPRVAATQGGPAIPERTLTIPKPVKYGGSMNGGYINNDKGPTSNGNERVNTDPQPNSYNGDYYIEAINACMNRNRDNNGNGRIDADELRWYVPAMGKYLRLVLGHNTLQSYALMQYEDITDQLNTDNRYNTRYLFYSSDNRVLWGMEGLSTSRYGQYCNSPWQIRCIRNLGSNMSTVTPGEKVVPAYTHDVANKRVTMSYYDSESIRTIRITGKGNGNGQGQMPIHLINSDYNTPYSAFEYSDLTNRSITLSIEYVQGNDNPCRNLTGNGWRLPNQKELAIMRNLGLFEGLTGDFAPSCTMSYFNMSGMPGGTPDSTHRFMVTRKDGGTQVDPGDRMAGYRCVRDYPQNDSEQN